MSVFSCVAFTGLNRVIVKGKDTLVGMFAITTLASGKMSIIIECDPDKVVRLTEK